MNDVLFRLLRAGFRGRLANLEGAALKRLVSVVSARIAAAIVRHERYAVDELDENAVQWSVATQKAFDGHDFAVLILDREGKTRIDALAVHQNGASPARPLIATLLGSSEVQVVTERVEQGDAWLDA